VTEREGRFDGRPGGVQSGSGQSGGVRSGGVRSGSGQSGNLQSGSGRAGRIVVIGVGNEFRRDDGVGPAVIALLRDMRQGDADLAGVTLALSDGEPSRMIDLWTGAELAVVIDSAHDSRAHAGSHHEVTVDALTGAVHGTASSHGIGLGDTVALAQALGRMPASLVVLAVVGRDFGLGPGLTRDVAAAVAPLASRVREAVCSHRSTAPSGPA
jgi:hydrogenase maturation protease